MDVFFVDAAPEGGRLSRLVERIAGVHVVGRAAGARSALAEILAPLPDAVLLDVPLDEGSGFDVLRELRRHEPGIDCYMVTNYASEPYRRYAARLGAAGFFDRTSELDALCARLRAEALTPVSP